MKKRIAMILVVIMMVTMMSSNVMAAEVYVAKDLQNSIFKFNYQYTVTDRPKDSMGGDNITALNTGNIFAISNGLFVTAAQNLNRASGKTVTDESYFTKFEFKSKDIYTKKPNVVTIYAYYELIYVNPVTNIAIFKGDDFINRYSRPLMLAESFSDYQLYQNMFTTDYFNIINNKNGEIQKYEDLSNLITFESRLNSTDAGSPIMFENGTVVGVITEKHEVFNGKRLVEAYSINLQDLKDAVKEALKK